MHRRSLDGQNRAQFEWKIVSINHKTSILIRTAVTSIDLRVIRWSLLSRWKLETNSYDTYLYDTCIIKYFNLPFMEVMLALTCNQNHWSTFQLHWLFNFRSLVTLFYAINIKSLSFINIVGTHNPKYINCTVTHRSSCRFIFS